MSAGAIDPSLSNGGANTRTVFFNRTVYAYKRAERESDREFPSYAPIAHILQGFAASSISLDDKFSVLLDIQPYLKGPDDTGCSPDFTAMLVPVCKITDLNNGALPKNVLIFIWEVKALHADNWFSTILDRLNLTASEAKMQLKSYLRQLSGQALFAFHQYEGNTIPVFLSQGNFFTMLLYDRPPNWDTIAVKYADTLKQGPRQPTATGQPKPVSSRATTAQKQETPSLLQEQSDPLGQQDSPGVQDHAPELVEPAMDDVAAGNTKDTLTGTPDASAESAEPVFEDGDYPIPRLYYSTEDILARDGSGFSPQCIKAMNIAMKMRGVAFDAQDVIFRLPDGIQLDDIYATQSLDTAQAAIDAFKKEQEATKNPEQSCSATSLASSHVEYKVSRYAIIPPPDGMLWGLRRGRQIMYKSPPRKAARKEPIARRQPAKKPGPKRAKSSKKTRIDQSQDAPTAYDHVNAIAGPSNTHANVVAGPSNARFTPLRPPANSGMQDAGPSKKRKLDQVQEDTEVPVSADEGAGPSKKRGAAPRSRPVRFASQDAGPSERCGRKPSGDAPATDVLVNNTAAGPSDEQLTGRSAEASARNKKDPGQPSRKGKERAH